jgi:hypothetical protein
MHAQKQAELLQLVCPPYGVARLPHSLPYRTASSVDHGFCVVISFAQGRCGFVNYRSVNNAAMQFCQAGAESSHATQKAVSYAGAPYGGQSRNVAMRHQPSSDKALTTTTFS